jgi:hypothetical protein
MSARSRISWSLEPSALKPLAIQRKPSPAGCGSDGRISPDNRSAWIDESVFREDGVEGGGPAVDVMMLDGI